MSHKYLSDVIPSTARRYALRNAKHVDRENSAIFIKY